MVADASNEANLLNTSHHQRKRYVGVILCVTECICGVTLNELMGHRKGGAGSAAAPQLLGRELLPRKFVDATD